MKMQSEQESVTLVSLRLYHYPYDKENVLIVQESSIYPDTRIYAGISVQDLEDIIRRNVRLREPKR